MFLEGIFKYYEDEKSRSSAVAADTPATTLGEKDVVVEESLDVMREYLCGWIMGRGELIHQRVKSRAYIQINLYNDEEVDLFTQLAERVPYLTVDTAHRSMFSRFFSTYTMTTMARAMIKIYDDQVLMDRLKKYKERTKFCLRGFFEAVNGEIILYKDGLDVLLCDNENIFFDKCVYTNASALNFITDLYEEHDELAKVSNLVKIDEAKMMISSEEIVPELVCIKDMEHAILPFKNSALDVGVNITVIEKVKEVNGVHYYTTGLTMSTNYGYYMELHGHKLYEQGYALASGTIILDDEECSNTTLVIPLVKLDASAPELKLPAVAAKLLCKKINLVDV